MISHFPSPLRPSNVPLILIPPLLTPSWVAENIICKRDGNHSFFRCSFLDPVLEFDGFETFDKLQVSVFDYFGIGIFGNIKVEIMGPVGRRACRLGASMVNWLKEIHPSRMW